MLLCHRGAGGADRHAQNARGFAFPGILAIRAGRVVDGILQNAGDGPVVFRRDEQQPPRRRDFLLDALDGLSLICVVVLIVQRQVADLELFERNLRRRQFSYRIGELAVE